MKIDVVVKIKRCFRVWMGVLNAERPGQRSEVRVQDSEYAQRLTLHALRASCAFTLIELLVVMVIAVVIMAVSLPSFLSMGRGAGMRTAVNNVRSTVALSRQWAITHREQITFMASSTGMVWTTNNLAVPATNDHACYYATNAAGTLVQSITDLPLDVRFESPLSLTFKTDGGLDGFAPGNEEKIKLVDKKRTLDVERTITINGITGGIKVQ